MNRIRLAAIGAIVSGALVCAALVTAQQQKAVPPRNPLARVQAVETSRDSRMIGIGVVRLINEAEADYNYSHGSYASWRTLLESGAIADAQKRSAIPGMKLSDGTDVVPGWALGLIASASGPSYELSLRNASDPCGFSFFSDEHGVIFQGGVIDCSMDLKPTWH